ncbi:hypothetical protein BGZ99_001170, partial [Dissophora globulifera]
EVCKKIFDTYHEKGGNFYDTANVYTNGDSERFLGEYIADKRSECVIATKYSVNQSFAEVLSGNNVRSNPNAGGNHRKNMVESLDASLKRLGTGYVDILYVHLWEYRTPVHEVMRALDDVVRSGKALYVAISNTPSWVVSSTNTMAELRGLTPFIGFQTRYNLLDRSLESEIQPMCAEHGLGIVPWSVLAEGFLTGKHTRQEFSKDTKREGRVAGYVNNDKNWKILEEVQTIAKECKKTPAQVATNWMLQRPGITSPLIGARTLEQLQDNLGALEFTLSKEQMARLDHVSNPAEWQFPYDAVRGLPMFTGNKVEMLERFRPMTALGTSKN